MHEVLTDLSPQALARANELNWREGYSELLAKWPRGLVHEGPGAYWLGSDLPHPLMNQVLRCEFSSETVDTEIEQVLSAFGQRRVPLWWWVMPSSRPASLGEHLKRHRLVWIEDMPGMAMDLERLPDETAAPSGLSVERVETPAQLKAWTDVYARGFPVPAFLAHAHQEILTAAGLGPGSNWHHYLGRVDGKPVATASVYEGAGVAGLYYVSVLPEARGKGVATALVTNVLRTARSNGYRAAILQATRMGLPVYQRMGFELCCTYPEYRWEPPPHE